MTLVNVADSFLMLRHNVDSFIETGFIDPKKVDEIKGIKKILQKKRQDWALRETIGRRNGLIVFGAHNALYRITEGIEKELLLGIQLKENPVKAKKVKPLVDDLVQFSKEVDAAEEGCWNDLIEIDQTIDQLYASARDLKIELPAEKYLTKKINEKLVSGALNAMTRA